MEGRLKGRLIVVLGELFAFDIIRKTRGLHSCFCMRTVQFVGRNYTFFKARL